MKYRAILSVVMACVLLLMVGCKKADTEENVTFAQESIQPAAQTSPTGSAGGSDDKVSTEGESEVIAEKETQTRHITEEDQNVKVDADVMIPAKDAYSTYTMGKVDCSPERLFTIFSPEGFGTYTTEERSYTRYCEESGKKLVVRKNAINYSAFNIDLAETPMQDTETIMYYYTQEYPQQEPHDLSFMSAAEMEQYCRDIITQVGVAFEPKLTGIATLTGQEIMDFQQELFSNGGKYTERGYTPTNLTSAEDTCYLEFSFTYDGLPLLSSQEPMIASAVSMMPTSPVTATMMINAEGLQVCDIQFPSIINTASEPQKILTLEDAVTALKEKYALEIRNNPKEFTRIWLEYIPIVKDEEVKLTPYWCFLDKESANAERFNAFTGMDLTYEG